MYNAVLNDRWTNKLKSRVEGKKILLVGNATSMFSQKFGEEIDSYDFVLRFGKGVPYAKFSEYLGTKTDAWFFGTARAGMFKHFKQARFKIYSVCQLSMYKDNTSDLLSTRAMYNGSFQVYRDFFLAGDSIETMKANKEINGDDPDARLSQGAHCAHFFNKFVQSYDQMDFIGFDFFGQEFKYDYNSGKKHIPVEQPTTSWHMPLISKEYDRNPHRNGVDDSGMSNEERFIRSLPKVNVRKMPPNDMEKLAEVLEELRGEEAKIKME